MNLKLTLSKGFLFKRNKLWLSLFLLLSSYTVNAQLPTITTFSPLSGKAGDAVTITGTNFNTTPSNNIVFFGSTRATVTAASSTSLIVTVPLGAAYAPITLLNTSGALSASSTRFFSPTFTPVKGSITTADIAAKQDYTSGSEPYSVAIGDLDGDGKSDLVVSNYTSNTISVYRNTSTSGSIGSSSFAAKVDFATGDYPISVAIGDLDGDGKPDLAVVNNLSDNVSVYRNTSSSGSISTSSFATKVDFVTGFEPYSVAIGDLDVDGKLDLAVVNNGDNTVSILRNTSFSGVIDLSSFATKVDFATSSRPTSVAIGDLDGNGKPDLAVVNSLINRVSVFRNTSTSGSIVSSSFAAKVDFITGVEPFSVAIGDLDVDGKLDLAVANRSGNSVSVLRNTSTSGSIVSSSFAAKVDFATGSSTGPNLVAIGDMNGDGKPDLVTANNVSDNISIFRNTSTSGSIVSSSFAGKVDFATGNTPYAVAIGDLDGDGKPDLAVANSASNSISVFRNTPQYSINANLSALSTTAGTLSPSFAAATTVYTAAVSSATASVTVSPTAVDATASIEVRVNGGSYATVVSGATSSALSLNEGSNTIDVKVTAQDGITIKTYTITVTRAATLPVTLINYTAKLNTDGTVQLTWLTASEINNNYFRLLRSNDGSNFITIATLTGAGNSNLQNRYSFTDLSPLNGTNYYQLVQYDKDGKKADLGIRTVEATLKNVDFIAYPNPSSHLVNLSFEPNIYQKVELVDVSGKVLSTKLLGKQTDKISFDISNFASGIYHLRLSGKGKTSIKQIIKQ